MPKLCLVFLLLFVGCADARYETVITEETRQSVMACFDHCVESVPGAADWYPEGWIDECLEGWIDECLDNCTKLHGERVPGIWRSQSGWKRCSELPKAYKFCHESEL